ncbi:undecaprenyldiphospho-muramoylpentapeptide beta-N-acetylglucosaminyltransferase [Dissulfurimicrobium hydrothermale]|uniref:undecaprenyldiphospho-muramoylpentapeptide beta-N-acetylglucosaminyltransferase n=1 Tax=Dissulfurimicrobium hydrothermale TaxID=1750598 RepID=UPI001EDBCF83|nr:undecaprenyldiphospho-muramoylpentapeptide beta-N-acetylglucosaminyltransferase [Dissulfurimicrobium hydrothermale]UKL12887.1 undecaprenyldiphospho-muramoylpentapeptide beta-N-acetylglucosaminyltransferase [Dissulfurimicrobium hydrothermale]
MSVIGGEYMERQVDGRGAPLRLVVAGGGTGGHVFPGIAVVEALSEVSPVEVMWIGAGRPVEKEVLKDRPWRYRVLEVRPLLGVGGFGMARSILGLPYHISRSFVWLRDFRPDIVFGVGGYVSGPVLLAARILGMPTVLHEQNLVPGLANRIAARFVNAVLLSFEQAEMAFPKAKTVVTGNPVRPSLLFNYKEEARAAGAPLRLLIIGGSQGARGLNRLASSAVALLSKSGVRLEIMHQTGPVDLEAVRSLYDEVGVKAVVYPFINDMAMAYSWADLVVCRAGAGTIAELTALGKPSVLIPYPAAADRHQDANAKALADAGGAIYFCEEDIGAVKMASEIQALLEDQTSLKKMAEKAKEMGRPDAAKAIASILVDMAVKR